MKTQDIQFRKATSDDRAQIRVWLAKDAELNPDGNFRDNFDSIHRSRYKHIFVAVHGPTEYIVAFQYGGLINLGIMLVRDEYKRKGIGTEFVQYLENRALDNGQPVLRIHCHPETSIPFWKSVGFEMIEKTDSNQFATKALQQPLSLTKPGPEVNVKVGIYQDGGQHNQSTSPMKIFNPEAIRTGAKVIILGQRISFPCTRNSRNTVIKIEVNEEEIYFGRARYRQAESYGLIQCENGYYLDKILLGSETS